MSNTDHNPLLQLTLRLRQQYRDLDRVLDAMNAGSDLMIESISEHMKSIRETEARLHPLREQQRRINAQLPAELQQPTDETIELLKGIMPKLAQLEKATIDSSQRLFPKIQQSVRAVQMQNAYQNSHRVS